MNPQQRNQRSTVDMLDDVKVAVLTGFAIGGGGASSQLQVALQDADAELARSGHTWRDVQVLTIRLGTGADGLVSWDAVAVS